MATEMQKTMYELAKGEGYSKDIDTYLRDLSTNKEMQKAMYSVAKDEGYTKPMDSFLSGMAVVPSSSSAALPLGAASVDKNGKEVYTDESINNAVLAPVKAFSGYVAPYTTGYMSSEDTKPSAQPLEHTPSFNPKKNSQSPATGEIPDPNATVSSGTPYDYSHLNAPQAEVMDMNKGLSAIGGDLLRIPGAALATAAEGLGYLGNIGVNAIKRAGLGQDPGPVTAPVPDYSRTDASGLPEGHPWLNTIDEGMRSKKGGALAAMAYVNPALAGESLLGRLGLLGAEGAGTELATGEGPGQAAVTGGLNILTGGLIPETLSRAAASRMATKLGSVLRVPKTQAEEFMSTPNHPDLGEEAAYSEVPLPENKFGTANPTKVMEGIKANQAELANRQLHYDALAKTAYEGTVAKGVNSVTPRGSSGGANLDDIASDAISMVRDKPLVGKDRVAYISKINQVVSELRSKLSGTGKLDYQYAKELIAQKGIPELEQAFYDLGIRKSLQVIGDGGRTVTSDVVEGITSNAQKMSKNVQQRMAQNEKLLSGERNIPDPGLMGLFSGNPLYNLAWNPSAGRNAMTGLAGVSPVIGYEQNGGR